MRRSVALANLVVPHPRQRRLDVNVLGLDATFGGTGWCVANRDGPIRAGHWEFPGQHAMRTGRSDDRPLRMFQRLDALLVELTAAGVGVDLVVIERMPSVYGNSHGNQAETGYGLGRSACSIELWALLRGLPVWLVPPADDGDWGWGWRPWWIPATASRAPVTRERWKAFAVDLVQQLRWAAPLAPFLQANTEAGAERAADVAEGILIAAGAARNLHLCPVNLTRKES